MDDALSRLFASFDRGTITRRQLLQAIGLAAVAVPISSAIGQGRCGGARAGTAVCDTVPWKYPFEPTGWTTVALDHFSMQCADYEKEAAYYAALMGWKVRSDDGSKAILDIGDDVGGVVIRGGYQAPPPPPPRAAGDTMPAGRGGRGPRPPRNVVWDNFSWAIRPWDKTRVETELKKRGLNPIADNDQDFESFHVKDPDGFDLQISNGATRRRRGSAAGKLVASVPFEPTGWKTVWLDHISFQASNYKESVAFYSALLGWKPTGDEGSQNECEIGEVGNIIIRGGNPAAGIGGGRAGGGGGARFDSSGGRGGQAAAPMRRAQIDHVSFGITPFDPDRVKAELDKRGLSSSPDTGGKGDIHDVAARYKSYHTTTPEGFNLQISNIAHDTRNVR